MSSASNLWCCHYIVLCTFIHLPIFLDIKNYKNWPYRQPFWALKSKSHFFFHFYRNISFEDFRVLLFLVFHLKNCVFSFCSNFYNPASFKEPSLYNKKTFFNSVKSVWKLESYTKILCKKFIFDTHASLFFLRFLFMPHRMQVCCTIKWWLTFQLNFASG